MLPSPLQTQSQPNSAEQNSIPSRTYGVSSQSPIGSSVSLSKSQKNTLTVSSSMERNSLISSIEKPSTWLQMAESSSTAPIASPSESGFSSRQTERESSPVPLRSSSCQSADGYSSVHQNLSTSTSRHLFSKVLARNPINLIFS